VFPQGMMSQQAMGGRGGFGGRGGGGGRGARGDVPPAQPATPSQDKVIMVEPQRLPVVTIDRLAGNETKPVTFKVRLNGIAGTDCTIRYASTRGGVVEKKIYVGKK
jgi:hypothetical protein